VAPKVTGSSPVGHPITQAGPARSKGIAVTTQLLARLPSLLRWLTLAFPLLLAACGQGEGASGAPGGY
jgi:hypothetical protein